MKRTDITLDDGKLFVFMEAENALKMLNRCEHNNRDQHKHSGGTWWSQSEQKETPDLDLYRERCGLTGMLLLPEDGVYMVISNQAGVPNRYISKKRADVLGLKQSALLLTYRWRKAQAAIRKFADWLNG